MVRVGICVVCLGLRFGSSAESLGLGLIVVLEGLHCVYTEHIY